MKHDNINSAKRNHLRLFYHTTNIIALVHIFQKDKGIIPRYNKYLEEKLAFFYYGKHLGYINSQEFISTYFPIVLGIIPGEIENYTYQIYPFDSGGMMNRLKYDRTMIDAYKLNLIDDVDSYIKDVFGDFSMYFLGNHLAKLPKKYNALYSDIDNSISLNKVDSRIKNIELSSHDKISIDSINYMLFPRQFLTKESLKHNLELLFDQYTDDTNDTKQLYYNRDVEDSTLPENGILVEMLKADPYLRNTFKENIGLYNEESLLYANEGEYINFKPMFLVNDLPFLSGFCSIINSIDKDYAVSIQENRYYEICYSNGRNQLFFLSCNDLYRYLDKKSNHDNYIDNFYNRYGYYLKKLPKTDIEFQIMPCKEEYWTYKITNDFIVFGTRELVIKVLLLSIGGIQNKANTYNEICEFINRYPSLERIDEIHKIINFYEHTNLLYDDTDLLKLNIENKLSDLEINSKFNIRFIIKDGVFLIKDKYYGMELDILEKYKEIFLLRGMYGNESSKDNNFSKSSRHNSYAIFETRRKRCVNFLKMFMNYNK